MKVKSCLIATLLLAASFLGGCSSSDSSFKPTPHVKDASSKASNPNTAEIDSDAEQTEGNTIASTTVSSQSVPVVASDDSQVRSMDDGFGNTTQSRTFYGSSLLRMVTLRTSKNGFRQAFVYGINGEVRELPAELTSSSMTLSAADIAKHAQLTAPTENAATMTAASVPSSIHDWPEVNNNVVAKEQTAAPVSTAKNDQAEPARSASDDTLRLRRKLNVFEAKPKAIKP